VPAVIRHDNLKAAVVRACFLDPDSHEVYLAFAAHWGFTPLPTRPRNPKENGKQEPSGGYVKSNALKGRRFDSLAAQNAFLRAQGQNDQADPGFKLLQNDDLQD
jgi:transposase